MSTRLRLVLLGFVLWGCGSPPSPEEVQDQYFSLREYFEREVRRLSTLRPRVEKTVRKNDQQEKRTFKELDWATELEIFVNSDINKPAWRSSYAADSTGSTLTYHAKEDDLRVRTIRIERSPQGTVSAIVIERSENNYLYSSSELLTYYPDSVYSIERHQKVRALGADEFRVSGRFE